MRYEDTTGLDREQLTELTGRVHARLGGWTSRGRLFALGLFNSLTVCRGGALLRQNLTPVLRWRRLRGLPAHHLAPLGPAGY